MKEHTYLPIKYHGSTGDNSYEIFLKEHAFFNRMRSEKIFSYLDFLGIEIPAEIPADENIFLFHDLTLDKVYFITCRKDDSGEKVYHFTIAMYMDTHKTDNAEFQFC